MMSVRHRAIDRTMTRGEATVSWSDTAEVALARMQRLGCDYLAVIDPDGVVIGLCERNVLLACQGHGDWLGAISVVDLMRRCCNPDDPVNRFMRPGPFWCHEDASVEEVLAIMEQLQTDTLAVLDQDQQVAGIVHRRQLLTMQDEEGQPAGEARH